MENILVTAEGGLTGAGYAVCILAGIILFLIGVIFAGKNSERKKISTRQVVIISIPAVSKALGQVKKTALQ